MVKVCDLQTILVLINVIYCSVQIHNNKMPMLFCLLLMYTSEEEEHLFVLILIILSNSKLKLKVQCLKILEY